MDREMQNPATQFEACSEEGYDETTLELLALLGEEADEVTAEEVKRERAVEEERQARKRRQRAEKELSEQLQLLKNNCPRGMRQHIPNRPCQPCQHPRLIVQHSI